MEIEHLELRREVGNAIRRIEKSDADHFDSIKDERSRLHQEWQELEEKARQKRKELDALVSGWRAKANPKDREIISEAKNFFGEELILYEDPERTPACCAATGLLLLESDDVYGDAEYGSAVLKAAVEIKI